VSSGEQSGPPAWVEAAGTLEQLQRAATTFALLGEAHRSGLLRAVLDAGPAADSTADPAALAEAVQVDAARVEAVLLVLAAHGIVEQQEGGWRLAPGWSELVGGGAPMSLPGVLGLGRVWAGQFGSALHGGQDYWELDATDRVDVATGISPDPFAPATTAMAGGLVASLPGVADALGAGGHILELGCGLASRLCALLRAYPRATAVGVELDAELVASAWRRAEQLGVADRLELVVGDAADYRSATVFDVVNWSQFFFPAPTRAGALATAHAALRPGGWVSMPVVWTGERPPPRTVEDQELAEMRLVLELWRVPMLSVAQVEAELTEAGFVDVHHEAAPGFHLVRGRRP